MPQARLPCGARGAAGSALATGWGPPEGAAQAGLLLGAGPMARLAVVHAVGQDGLHQAAHATVRVQPGPQEEHLFATDVKVIQAPLGILGGNSPYTTAYEAASEWL